MIDTTQTIESMRQFEVVVRTAKHVNFRERKLVVTDADLIRLATKFDVKAQQARQVITSFNTRNS